MNSALSMRTILKACTGLLMTSALLACSSYPDVNSDPAKNNKQAFQRDALDCAKSYPEVGSGVHVKQRIACMNLKGWH